uniref:ABC-type glutathione-S-conjugate transporter n=1 Tax=Clastoptera arizonana TaxID=38151 RepID=A0A1B6E9X5_9HEMI
MSSGFCDTRLWDTNKTWNTSNPDFTLCFEKTVLVWVPCLFLWIFSPLEIYYILHSNTRNVPWSVLNILKLSIVLLLIFLNIIQYASASMMNSKGDLTYAVDIWTPVVRIVTFLYVLILILWNKYMGLRTSGLLFLFWFCLTLFGIPQFHTDMSIVGTSAENTFNSVLYMMQFILVTVSLILHCFSDTEPKVRFYPKSDMQCPHLGASFPSRLFFVWYSNMTWKGFKKALTAEDLWSLRPQDTGSNIIRQFNKFWIPTFQSFMKNKTETKGRNKKTKSLSVLWPLLKAFLPAASIGFVLRLMGDMCSLLGPLLLRWLVAFVSRDDQPPWQGYMLSVLLFSIAEVQTLFLTHSVTTMYELGLRVRTALISAVYKKALRCSNSARKESTVGQIVNLMAVDSQRFYDLMPFLNLAWSAPLIVTISFILLWHSLGIAALAGIVVMLAIIPINSVFAKWVTEIQTHQMKLKDERIKKMNEILSGIRVLKCYAWELSFQEEILKIREEELRLLRSAAFLNATTSFFWTCSPFLVGLVTFGVFVLSDERNILTAELAFYCIALIGIMRSPISMLPSLIQMGIIANVSLNRINSYLSSDELDENAVLHNQEEMFPLLIENGIFTWEPEQIAQPTLKDINIKIGYNELVAVVGSVGSGKSSLLAAFLGEMKRLSGYVNTKGKIAFVGQQPWIQNASLRDNILFGSVYEERKYRRVIAACSLQHDISLLPAGDMTEIGERGVNLSGGQKQRVSLARAVYNDAQVYLLDHPLSAVDSHIGKHIFNNVIGRQGLLKKKTRVLVTHAMTFLPQVDMIYVMKDGTITETGTYSELLARKHDFTDFLMQNLFAHMDTDSGKDINVSEILGPDTELRNKFDRQMSVIGGTKSVASLHVRFCIRQDSAISGENIDLDTPEVEEEPNKNKLIQDEHSETGWVKISTFTHYFRAAGWCFVFLTVIFDLISQLLSICTLLWLSKWTSDPSTIFGVGDMKKRLYYLTVFGVIGVGKLFFSLMTSIMLVFGTISASRWLHITILANIFHLPMSFFNTTPTGRIMNRFSKDMDTIDNLIPINYVAFINCIVQVVGILFVISYSTPMFVAVILPIAMFYIFIQRFYLSTSRQLKRIECVSRSPIFSHFSETINGAPTIRAYKAEHKFIKVNEDKVDKNQMCLYPSMISNRWLSVRLETVGNVIIFFAAILAVIRRDSMEAGTAGVSISYALQVTMVLNFLVRMTSDLETNIVAVERIKEYAEVPQEAPWWLTRRPDQSWPETGKIEFRNFHVRYREGLELVLKGISVIIKGGEKVGIVGRPGAGKSTLTLCLFRILEAAEGSILIDGVDISKMGLNDLRSHITVIPQDPVLFSGTLRMNLNPFGLHSDDKLWECLKLAHLGEFVKGLPEGLDFIISENGDNLSVGQAQLLCLARALLRNTKVVVLHESTASFDIGTDDVIRRTIKKHFKECTVLMIAHRLNTIMDCDRILVLDKGHLKECDSPSNLLADKMSLFYGLVQGAGLV